MHSHPNHLNGQMLMAMDSGTIKLELRPTLVQMFPAHPTSTESVA
jgi:hypothetical protein